MKTKKRSIRNTRSFRKHLSKRNRKQASLDFERLEPRQVLSAVPLVVDDLSYITALNTNLVISQTTNGVLNNDFDADSTSLTASKVNNPDNGSLTFNSNGTFTYTPNTGFEGVDSFTYKVSDGPNTSVEAVVQITVGQGLTGALNGDNISSNLMHDGVLSFSQPIGSGLELGYRSDTMPVVLVPIETILTAGTAIPDTITAELVIDGVSSGNVVFDNTGLQTGEKMRFVLRVITPNTTTGMYDWTINATLNYSASADITRTFTGSEAVVNRIGSEFGDGFWLKGLDRVYDSTAGALLVNGDGSTLWFEKDGSNYLMAAGDYSYSTLVENSGGDFSLTDKWGDSRNFDAEGYITDIQSLNNSNASFTFQYDSSNRIQKITDEFGREATFTFDSNDKLSAVNDFYGRTTNVTITNGRVDSVTLSDETATGYTAPTWDFDYQQIGSEYFLDEVTDPAGNTTEYVYLHATRRLKQINNADHTTLDPSSWQIFPMIGEGVSIPGGSSMLKAIDADPRYIDENGNVFHFRTDRFGNLVSQIDALDATTTFEFDSQGLLYRITGADPDGAGSQTSPVTKFGYSSLGDLTFTEYADGETNTATYHATLHVVTGTTNELGDSEAFAYDSVGNLLSYTDVEDNVWSYTYDGHGNLLIETSPDPDGSGTLYAAITTTYAYDSTYYHRLLTTTWDNDDFQLLTYTESDQIATFTDEAGNVTAYEYDPLDRLTKMTLPDPDGSGLQISPIYTYTYGSDLQLESETDPLGNITSYEYNSRGWLTNTVFADPDGSGSLSSPEVVYAYDKVGNLIEEIRPEFDGVSIEYSYDDNGQLITVDGPVSGQQTSYTYDDLGRTISMTDPSGRTVSYEYDERNRLLKFVDHDPDGSGPEIGPITQYQYDAGGRTVSVTDPLGRVTAYAYFANGLLKSVTRPDPDRDGSASAPVTSYIYDALGRLSETTTPSERTTENEYNIFGQTTKFIGVDPDSEEGWLEAPETTYVYDSLGNLTSVTNELGHVTSFAYDNLGRQLNVTLPDPDGAGSQTSPVSSVTYDAVGNVLTTTDALGRTTTRTLDNLYRQLTVTQPDPDGSGSATSPVWSFAYSEQGLLATTTDPLSHTTTRSYDTAGRLVSITNAGNNTTNYGYDLLNRTTSITTPDPDGSGSLSSSVTTFSYDIYSQLVSTVEPGSTTTTRTYDAAGQLLSLTDASGNTTRWAYDDLGRMTMETDPRDLTRSFNHNIVDRLVRYVDRNGRITRYANDGLKTIEQWYEREDVPKTDVATTTEGSSGVNEVQTVTLTNLESGAGGGGGFGGGGSTPVDFFRLSFGGQVSEPLAATATASDVETALEELGSIDNVQVTLSGSTFTITFIGGQAGVNVDELMADVFHSDDGDLVHEITLDHDALYRLIEAEDDFATYNYTLDNLGRVTHRTEDFTTFSPVVDLSFTYDVVGKRTSIATKIGANLDYRTNYNYDDLNRLTTLEQTGQTGGNSVADKRIEFAHNSLGQLTVLNRFKALTGTNPALRTVYQYDSANRLTLLAHQDVTSGGASSALHSYSYSYDAMDRFVSIDSSIDGLSSFSFDGLSQLTDADHSSQADEDYDYDATGNRNGTGFTIGDDNLTLSDGTYDYEYDNEGNRTRKTEISSGDYGEYTWDHRNRLTKVTQFDSFDTELSSIQYNYDVFNRMVRRTYDADGPGGSSATDQFFAGFDGKHWTLEFDGNSANDLVGRYLWNGEILVANEVVTSLSAAGEIQWALNDHLGTVRDIGKWNATNGEFEIANHRVFSSFGQLISETNSSVELAYGFTGQWLDEVTGLTHHLNRWFDASLGKWLSDDPKSFAAGDTNLQRYVANRPLTYTDPSGLDFGEQEPIAMIMDGGDNQGRPVFENHAGETRWGLLVVIYFGEWEVSVDHYNQTMKFAEENLVITINAGVNRLNRLGQVEPTGLAAATADVFTTIIEDGSVTDYFVNNWSTFIPGAKSGGRKPGGCFVEGTIVLVSPENETVNAVLGEPEIVAGLGASNSKLVTVILLGTLGIQYLHERRKRKVTKADLPVKTKLRTAESQLDYSPFVSMGDKPECLAVLPRQVDADATITLDLQDNSVIAKTTKPAQIRSTIIKRSSDRFQDSWRKKDVWFTWAVTALLLFGLALASFQTGVDSSYPTVGQRISNVSQAVSPTLEPLPIEKIQLGQRVVTNISETQLAAAIGDPADLPWWDQVEIIAEDWRQISMVVTNDQAEPVDVHLLRPIQWITDESAQIGSSIFLSLPELGVEGDATISSIAPCPPIHSGSGRVVTGRFIHRRDGILNIKLANVEQTVGVTNTHHIYSVDRQDFIPAGELRVGETLEIGDFQTQITSIETRFDTEQVFNLEVHGEHVFRVGKEGLLVHNENGLGGRKGNFKTRKQNKTFADRAEAAEEGTHTAGVDLPERHYPNPIGERRGGRYSDVEITRPDGTRRVVQTVDTGRDGLPTDREIDAALDIYERLRPGDTLELFPK